MTPGPFILHQQDGSSVPNEHPETAGMEIYKLSMKTPTDCGILIPNRKNLEVIYANDFELERRMAV